MEALSEGTILENRYRVLRLLGEGGMSRVYLGEDTRLGVRVAIKENLQTSSEAQFQFQREAQILAHLSHPNLPRVTDYFIDTATGRQYLIMDYVEGEDLESMIKRKGPIPERTALAWMGQVISALEYLHRQMPPVVHRDVKPSNIKITPEGKAVLVDFGIAKVYEPGTPTLTGARAITPGYAPPEQYGMRTTARSDIYALGATLYTMITGRVPPEAPLRIAGEERLIPPRHVVPSIAPQTEAAILRAMELETTKRWRTMSEFREALEKAHKPGRPEPPTVPVSKLAGPSALSRIVGKGKKAATAISRPRNGFPPAMPWVIGIGAAIVILGAVFFGFGSGGGDQSLLMPTPVTVVPITLTSVPMWTPTPTSTPTGTPTSTPTATPSLTPTSTLTPTATPTPTATATRTPRPTPTPSGRVNREAINVRAGPGTVYNIIGGLKKDDVVEIIARTQEGDWFKVRLSRGGTGWIAAFLLDVSVSIERIPITREIPSTPTPTPIVITLDNAAQVVLVHSVQAHHDRVTSVTFSPDGRMLASGSDDHTVRLWRVSDWKLLRTLKGHTSYVTSVAFSPDGRMLASGSDDHTVRLWRVSNWKLLHTLKGHTSHVTSVAFSPNGATLVSGSADKTVRLWRVSDGVPLRTLEGHTTEVSDVVFAPDGATLASGSGDTTVRLWRVPDGKLLSTLTGHTAPVVTVAFLPDGQTLASGSYDGTVRLWRVSDGSTLHVLRARGNMNGVAVDPKGTFLVAGGGAWDNPKIWLWRISDGVLLGEIDVGAGEAARGVAFSPLGHFVAAAFHDGQIRLWGIR